VLILGIALAQVQDLALGLVEPHKVHVGTVLGLVQVPLGDIPALRCVEHTTHLRDFRQLADGALDPAVYVTDDNIKQYWSQYGPSGDTMSWFSPSQQQRTTCSLACFSLLSGMGRGIRRKRQNS